MRMLLGFTVMLHGKLKWKTEMLIDTETCRENHQQFISRIIESEVVWGLLGHRGFADCDSNEADAAVIMFWSDRAYATRVQQHFFREYEPQEVSLFDFLFHWLPGMAADGVLAGTNWTADLIGLEFASDELQNTILSVMNPEQARKYKTRLEGEVKQQPPRQQHLKYENGQT